MASMLSDARKQQVIALGQLGWTLRRIEAATGVRRETAGAYLKAAGLAVRPPGRWGHPPANPAKEVSTDLTTPAASPSAPPTWPPGPQRAPTASACAPYRELIELALARGRKGWYCDLRSLRYLSHFITPISSPIRFTARFFLGPIPAGQEPRLFTEETSEGFWIFPGEGYRRFLAGEMKMAEPAEYGLAYLAPFASFPDLWAAHDDGRHKFHGIVDRIHVFWDSFDWKRNRFPGNRSRIEPATSDWSEDRGGPRLDTA